MVLTSGITPRPFRGVSRAADMSSLWGRGDGERQDLETHFHPVIHTLQGFTQRGVYKLSVGGQLTIVGLKSSLRSLKLERKRVIGVSMGRNRMIDELGVILFNNFFHDALKINEKKNN